MCPPTSEGGHLIHVYTNMVELFLLPRVFSVRYSVRKRLHKPLVESSDACFDAKAPLSVVPDHDSSARDQHADRQFVRQQ